VVRDFATLPLKGFNGSTIGFDLAYEVVNAVSMEPLDYDETILKFVTYSID